MSDERRDRIIAEISIVFSELRRLEVRPQHINFKKLSVEDLEAELDAVSEQLKRRKIFRGELNL